MRHALRPPNSAGFCSPASVSRVILSLTFLAHIGDGRSKNCSRAGHPSPACAPVSSDEIQSPRLCARAGPEDPQAIVIHCSDVAGAGLHFMPEGNRHRQRRICRLAIAKAIAYTNSSAREVARRGDRGLRTSVVMYASFIGDDSQAATSCDGPVSLAGWTLCRRTTTRCARLIAAVAAERRSWRTGSACTSGTRSDASLGHARSWTIRGAASSATDPPGARPSNIKAEN